MKKHLHRIGLFGGTFDPVHIGHLVVAEWLTEMLEIETTFWIPAFHHPFDKRGDISPAMDRLAMVREAVASYPKFQVSAFEVERQGVSYAIDTITHFRKEYPRADIYYFIGQDNLADFLKWRDPMKILENSYLTVFKRGVYDATEAGDLEAHPKVLLVDSPRIDISSTHIRQRIQKGLAWQSLVPGPVYRYINDHPIYPNEK